jgi:hypothetical protein
LCRQLPCAADCGGTEKSLVLSGLDVGKTSHVPADATIEPGLTHPLAGQNLTPRSSAAPGANPSDWAPLISTLSKGYTLVGYFSTDLGQCYAKGTVGQPLIDFLDDIDAWRHRQGAADGD